MRREEGILLVQRLMDTDYADETEADQLIAALKCGLGCPHISDYIFWDFDPQLTAERVVDRALAYEPFAL
ncbi:e9imm peptide [Streptomyces sp. NPDC007205]|uniref:e9imm peptide n=1 Tax=Streptomyces sp. NPDC007205 TaxID=3154316 RepID=UPI0034104458